MHACVLITGVTVIVVHMHLQLDVSTIRGTIQLSLSDACTRIVSCIDPYNTPVKLWSLLKTTYTM